VNNWPIVTEIPVLWGDMDDFGHVNNIIYLKWCETSRVELFRKVWDLKSLKMEDILSEEGMGPILANFNINYRIPVQYPDLITVKTRVTNIGNTSFGISHELYSKVNEKNIVANAESVVVMINYKLGEKIAIDEDNRSKLKQFFQPIQQQLLRKLTKRRKRSFNKFHVQTFQNLRDDAACRQKMGLRKDHRLNYKSKHDKGSIA
jgi:acyl-CoA thioester hydrolase